MSNVTNTRSCHLWLYDIIFLLVLVLAGYLRLTGVNWGEGQHQHPDENFTSAVCLKVCERMNVRMRPFLWKSAPGTKTLDQHWGLFQQQNINA